MLIVMLKPGKSTSRDELLSYLGDKVAHWWLPNDVVFVDELPHTASGKAQKLRLREMFHDDQLPS